MKTAGRPVLSTSPPLRSIVNAVTPKLSALSLGVTIGYRLLVLAEICIDDETLLQIGDGDRSDIERSAIF